MSHQGPSSLYHICMEYLVPKIESYARFFKKNEKSSIAIEKLAASITEDLLRCAFRIANAESDSSKKIWKDEWSILYTSKIEASIMSWDEQLINRIAKLCKNLRRLEVVHLEEFKPELVLKLPKNIITLDFDGQLVHRGQITKPLMYDEEMEKCWLQEATDMLNALLLLRRKPSEYVPTPDIFSLCELHLGTVSATSADLQIILKNCPCLRLLKHYQLAKALYDLHVDSWRKKQPLPVYKLKNLDVDYSHVIRCRMSPEWVLAPDALQLAVLLCPNTIFVRIRFDCSTPNDVLAPLQNLEKIKEFSAVCVSSGERTLLDFSDMVPLLSKNGPNSLSFLELKVIEEVEIHVIIENCVKLETLILSGCGYVTPPTCPSYNCQSYSRGTFKKLRLLFYADGDDFSWDHGVPECFWKASLLPSGRSKIVHLEGLFLEFPRIPVALSKELFQSEIGRLPFPELKVLSLCRYEELSIEDVAVIAGIPMNKSRQSNLVNKNLKYIRLSDCANIDSRKITALKSWFKECSATDIKLNFDKPENHDKKEKPFTFKIFRPRC